MIYAILGLLFLLADQFLKFWTVGHVELNANPGIRVLPFLNLTYVKNEGIAFGMFSDVSFLRWILLGLLVMFTVFIVLGIARGFLRTGLARFSGAMLLAGLLGNGVDRAIYGYVVDMLEPKLGNLTLPIFNIADFLVVVFGILFCISLLTGGIGAPEEDFDDEDEEEEERRPRRRSRRDEDEEEEPVRRPRRSAREEAPVRRVRREEEDEAPVRRRSSAEAPVRRRPAQEEEESARRTVRRSEPRPAQAEPTREAPQPVRRTVSRPVAEAEAVVRTVERPAAKPAAPAVTPAPKAAAPAAKPAAAPAAAPAARPAAEKPVSVPKASDDFDLDSILAEFK